MSERERNYVKEIREYLETHPSPLDRSQRKILDALKISQATFNRYVHFLIGRGEIKVIRFATTKIYEPTKKT